jgi:SecD/SecF fusion protein
MKQLKYRAITIIIICNLLLAACLGKPTKTIILVLEVKPLVGFDENNFREVIENRILINCKTSQIKKFSFLNNIATIEISGVPDNKNALESLISSLNQTGKGLQFYETYNANEILPYINDYSKKLNVQLTDSLRNTLKYYKQNTLEEKLKYKRDSIAIENNLNMPFNGLLTLFVFMNEQRNFCIPPGSQIGYCKPSDSTKLFSILNSGLTNNHFPKDLIFRTKRDDKNNIEIHTLKLSTPGNKAAMEGDLIDSAILEFDTENNTTTILMKFNVGNHETWRKLTKRCAPKNETETGKSIAIVYDDVLLSSPTVNGEIQYGNASISGGFTFEEANSLATRLNSGNIPCIIKVGHYEYK